MTTVKPKCPKCAGTEFAIEFIQVTEDHDCFSPVYCKNCGTIVGQMIEPRIRDSIAHLDWIPTLLKALDDAIHPLVHPSFVPAPGSRKA